MRFRLTDLQVWCFVFFTSATLLCRAYACVCAAHSAFHSLHSSAVAVIDTEFRAYRRV